MGILGGGGEGGKALFCLPHMVSFWSDQRDMVVCLKREIYKHIIYM